jgi:hypothetical protein
MATPEEMADWFLSEFEDPVHSLPHDSREGGYQYIWGGPYELRNELEGQFAPSDKDLEEAVRIVEEKNPDDTWDWTPTEERISRLGLAD